MLQDKYKNNNSLVKSIEECTPIFDEFHEMKTGVEPEILADSYKEVTRVFLNTWKNVHNFQTKFEKTLSLSGFHSVTTEEIIDLQVTFTRDELRKQINEDALRFNMKKKPGNEPNPPIQYPREWQRNRIREFIKLKEAEAIQTYLETLTQEN
jgi:hypothetical protein